MNKLYMYADESCHIQNDGNNVMALVTVYCKDIHRKMISDIIKKIMERHQISRHSEIKWGKVSNTNLAMYKEIFLFLKSVMDAGDIGIRCLVAKGKDIIVGDYSSWYHKMYYLMFQYAIDDNFLKYEGYHIFIDRKDGKSNKILPKIGKYLTTYSYGIEDIISAGSDSKEHVLMQIADIIAGSLTYHHRRLRTSKSKIELIDFIQKTFGINYNLSSIRDKKPFNIFIWSARYAKTFQN